MTGNDGLSYVICSTCMPMVTRIFGHIAIDQLVASRSEKDTREDIAEAQSNMAASSQPAFRQQGVQEVHVPVSYTHLRAHETGAYL
eukprot:5523214-Pyramimonas_sp.AAC.1